MWTNAVPMLIEPGVTYLNSAAFGPLSLPVHRRVEALRRKMAADPTDFQLRRVPDLLWRAREDLAALIGTAPTQLVFTVNATTAMNAVASSIRLRTPGEILLTDQEYETARWCWHRAAERLGLTLRLVALPADPAGHEPIVDAIRAAMAPDTRLLVFSHVLSATGLVMPAEAICAAARARGIETVIDGAQAPGFIDLKIDALGCDFYVGSCHKWLLAPMGCGFLQAAPGTLARLEPRIVSWGHRNFDSDGDPDRRDRFGSTPRLRPLECEGTRDLCAWLALPEAIALHRAWRQEGRADRGTDLARSARDPIVSELRLDCVTPSAAALSSGIISFLLPPSSDGAALVRALWERFRIAVSCLGHGRASLLRVAVHAFNTEADIDYLVRSLGLLLRH